MSIDGIGKRGLVPPGAAQTPESISPAEGAFELAGVTAAPTGTAESEALQALARGELSLEQYLDARVESAVAPLVSRLSADQLDFVRSELRSALETDPVLLELVSQATGTTQAR